MREFSFSKLAFIACFCLTSNFVSAQDDVSISGNVKAQWSTVRLPPGSLLRLFGADTSSNGEASSRLIIESSVGAWAFDAHGEILGISGDNLRTGSEIERLLASLSDTPIAIAPDRARLFGLPTDRRRLLGLTSEILSDDSSQSVVRLDRLSASYSTERVVLKTGRQALSLGNGLAFQALDVMNPFSPTAIDKDYKSGDDMLYAQYLFSDGSDLSGILVPRRNPETHELASDQSSVMGRYQRQLEEASVQFLAGAHYGEGFIGIGASRSVFDGVVRTDIALEDLEDRDLNAISVVNFERTWVVAGYNIQGFLEYYHNDIGVTESSYKQPGEALLNRVFRGEMYTLGRDYIALGGMWEISPLVSFYPLSITNLGDSSGLFQLRFVIDLLQDLKAQFGCSIPYGPRESRVWRILDRGRRSGPAWKGRLHATRLLLQSKSIIAPSQRSDGLIKAVCCMVIRSSLCKLVRYYGITTIKIVAILKLNA